MKRPKRIVRVATISVAILATAGLVAQAAVGRDATQSIPTVSVKDNRFSPKNKTVSSGDKVKWQWRGDNDHDVTFRKVPSGASKRSSKTVASGTFQRSFTKRGTYRYICTVHADEGMKGTVKAE